MVQLLVGAALLRQLGGGGGERILAYFGDGTEAEHPEARGGGPPRPPPGAKLFYLPAPTPLCGGGVTSHRCRCPELG
jgi:hypothetical protein